MAALKNIKKEVKSREDSQIGEVEIFEDFDTILIYNEIYFYGEKADKEIAKHIAKDMENAWNQPNGKIFINGKEYQVIFIIKGKYLPDTTPELIKNNPYPWRKFFRLEQESKMNISYVDGLPSNSGYFMYKNIVKPNSMTGAHELGHCFGLEHPEDTDFRGKGQPHIMFPRGTFVDREFRYKPEANILVENDKIVIEPGATLDTDKRRVTQQNIDDLHLQNLNYSDENQATLSKTTNKYHEGLSINPPNTENLA